MTGCSFLGSDEGLEVDAVMMLVYQPSLDSLLLLPL